MGYTFNFTDVWHARDELLWGVFLTIQLSAVSMVLSLRIAVFGAFGRTSGPRWLRGAIAAYVEFVRNTPFLVQLFFVYFGLPAAGLKLTETQAAFIAMTINLGAYSTEIIRAGIEATPKGVIEAGVSLAMTRLQVLRHVVLKPAFEKVWPALASQIIIVMLGSSVVSQISTEDLTYAANFIQSRNFRAFESYFVVALAYLMLAILARAILRALGSRLFPKA